MNKIVVCVSGSNHYFFFFSPVCRIPIWLAPCRKIKNLYFLFALSLFKRECFLPRLVKRAMLPFFI